MRIYKDGWGPVQVSSHTPVWPRRHGWNSNNVDMYDPAHYLTPADRYRLAHPRNIVRFLSTHPSQPNPYFERKVSARYASMEERGRYGQDINWVTLGTRGG